MSSRYIYLLTSITLFSFFLISGISCLHAQKMPEHRSFDEIWEQSKEPKITHKFFKHKDILPIVQSYVAYPDFEVNIIGQSFEGRDIALVKIGRGDRKVLLWTQMHGDEPTATMAALDIFRFFSQSDTLDRWKSAILQELTIYVIPMLNPDGAEVVKRRNALDIDLNRDAMRLQSPESILLKHVRDSLNPEFGFNLHDQSIYYTAGENPYPATTSFLAPAYNEAKDLNDTRANAMRLIVILNRIAQEYNPGHVGRFNDTFEPRAFGDNIQKWGTSTILIESGGFPGDPHKQTQRRLHFTLLLSAFEAIANKSFLYEGLREYDEIPYNNLRAHDLIIRNIQYPYQDSTPIIDIAYRRVEALNEAKNDFVYVSAISELGDLSTLHGYEEMDAIGSTYIQGKLYKGDWRKLQQMTIAELLREGYTHILAKTVPQASKMEGIPLTFILHERNFKNTAAIGRNPGFFLTVNGKRTHFVGNGFLYSIDGDLERFEGIKIQDLY